MSRQNSNPDKLMLKQKKGTWKRFVKIFPKCNLPWVWLVMYVALDLALVNIGIGETDYTAQLFSGNTDTALMIKLIGMIVLNLFASNLVVFARQMTSARIDRNMRSVLFEKVIRLPMTYFKNENPREAVYRIVSNATIVSSTIILVIIPLITAAYTAVSVVGRVFKYDWRLSVILIVFVPIQVLIAFVFGRLNRSLNQRDSAVNSWLMQRLAELVTNIPLAKAFAMEDREADKGAELTQRLYKLNVKASWLSQFKDLSETLVSMLESVVIVLVGVVLLRNGDIAKRSWIAFFLFSTVFANAISEFMMYWNNLKTIQGSADKIAEIMNEPEEDRSGDACENLRGDITFDNVKFGYEDNSAVFENLSCEFKDNCSTALLGVSGCGKTTLANLILRLYNPQEGKICVGGKSIHGYALEEYRDNFTVVSQNSMLFSGTVRENVCYGNSDVDDEAFEKALKNAGAYDFVMSLPDGADTVLEEYAGNLSGGQRQRLAMARAMLSEAHYMILDEPTSAMDAIASAELIPILADLAKDRCMIVIAHTPAVLSAVSRVVVIEDAAVSAQGEKDEVLKTNAFLQELVGEKVAQ